MGMGMGVRAARLCGLEPRDLDLVVVACHASGVKVGTHLGQVGVALGDLHLGGGELLVERSEDLLGFARPLGRLESVVQRLPRLPEWQTWQQAWRRAWRRAW